MIARKIKKLSAQLEVPTGSNSLVLGLGGNLEQFLRGTDIANARKIKYATVP